MKTPSKTPSDIINESGYPLQIRLENLIETTQEQHGWQILVSEHRWINPERSSEEFIDLVLVHANSVLRLVVECKRMAGNWVFLIPRTNSSMVMHVRILHAQYSPAAFTWGDLRFTPESYESAFCVMEADGKRDNRTLEKLSGEVLLALESVALEEMNLQSTLPRKWTDTYYLPAIVTTAKLQTCVFSPGDVSIEDGKIAGRQFEFEEIGFVRFRKGLAANLEYTKPQLYSLREVNRENERTVFVVQAKHLVDFLTRFGI